VKTVVDTNVVAYCCSVPSPSSVKHHFWHAVSQPIAPALWEAELANVVWFATGIRPYSCLKTWSNAIASFLHVCTRRSGPHDTT